MSIRAQLPKAVPFISVRDTLLSLAAAESLPFEAVAKFLLDRLSKLPAAFYMDPLLHETEPLPQSKISELLQAAAHLSSLGVEYDETDENATGPFAHEFALYGWNREELGTWLTRAGIDSPCIEHPSSPAPEAAAPIPSMPPAPPDEILQKFSTAPDDALLSISEAVHITGLSRATIYRHLDNGNLTKKKLDKSVRLPVGSLRKFISEPSRRKR